MRRKTKKSANYWEMETPIVTELDMAEIRYYKNAGKLQIYSVYEDKEGEWHLSRACVWDVNNFSIEDVLQVVNAVMYAFLEIGIEDSNFDKAYNIIKDAVEDIDKEDDDTTASTSAALEEPLDEEFADETEYSKEEIEELLKNLSLVQTKKVAVDFDIPVGKNTRKFELVDKLLSDCDLSMVYESLLEHGYIEDIDEEEPVTKSNNSKKSLFTVDGLNKEDLYSDWIIELDNNTLLEFYEFVMGKEYKTAGRFNRLKVVSILAENNDIVSLYEASRDFVGTNDEIEEPRKMVIPSRKDVKSSSKDLLEYAGVNVSFKDGKCIKAKSKIKKAYLECCEIAENGIQFIVEEHDKISNMPTKTFKQKKAQDVAYAKLNSTVEDWVSSWEEDGIANEVSGIANKVVLGSMDYDNAMAKFVELIDNLEL